MTLGQFAAVVGAPARWVQNARAVLGLRGPYDERGAKELGLARVIAEATAIPLTHALPMAQTALAEWPAVREVTVANDDCVRVIIDVERYLSGYSVRLSNTLSQYAERPRGRRRARGRNPVAAARDYGVDISLIDESLDLSPADRLRRLDDTSEFFSNARIIGR